MAGIGLNSAKTKLQSDVYKALFDAFKATFYMGAGEDGDEIANRFANNGAGKIADAIYNFITQAQIVGTLSGVVTGTCATGPVAGTNTDVVSGTELSII